MADKKLKPIFMPMTTVPMELFESFTPAEAMMKIAFKLNEVIEYVKTVDKKVDDIVPIIKQEVITELTPILDNLNNKIDNLSIELNNNLETFKIQINGEFISFKEEVNNDLIDMKNDIIDYVNQKIAELENEDLITAYGYDHLEITAQTFDNIQMTASEYDTISKIILHEINI